MSKVINLISGDVVKIRGNDAIFCVCVAQGDLPEGSVYIQEDIDIGRIVAFSDIVAVNLVKVLPGQTVSADRNAIAVER
jgi:hypothetical protein